MDAGYIKGSFFADIKNNTLSDSYIVQKYFCNGSSAILDDNKIFEIKHKISCEFGIHPNEVILTGSGKLGFSVAPGKDFKDFNDASDIDIAIISNKLFEQYWLELLEFNVNLISRTKSEHKLYLKFIDYLFKGWIRPDMFPFKYEGKNHWFEFFNTLTHEIYEYGEHKISAGIYKNFTTFELYNTKNIERIRNKVKAGVLNE